MVTDSQQIVQQEQVSQEPVSEEKVYQEETKVESPALTEERVQQLIAEATAKAVAEAKELGKRELQSSQDRNKAEMAKLQRRAQVAETTLNATKTQVKDLDPEIAKDIELAELRAKEFSRQEMEQTDAYTQQQLEVTRQFQENLIQHIEGLGVDPSDSRIDWALDAPDLLTAQRRVLASTAKIQKENTQAMTSSLESRLKELESKINKVNVEANSVETTASIGAVDSSDAEFINQFGEGNIPTTKANVDRYKSILAKLK